MEATPRPWEQWGNLILSRGHRVITRLSGGTNTSAPETQPGDDFWEQAMIDADFIVKAVNSHDDLLAACREVIDFVFAELRENPDKEDMDGSIIDRLLELQTGLVSVWRKAKGE